MMARRNSDLRFSRPPLLLRAFLALTALIALLAPMNFVLINPGPVSPLFPKVLALKESSVKSYPINGNLYLLTIYVTNPQSYIPGALVLGCWVKGDCAALPRSVMYEDGTTDKKETIASKKDMTASQSVALVAAQRYIAKKFPRLTVEELTDKDLKVSLEDTGGPSGGLVFTLGLIDLLTPQDILQGRKIAGTGTISQDGKIGAIGGVTEKILGAKGAGASTLFISRENCRDLPLQITGISVVAIDTIDEAVTYLMRVGKGSSSAGIHGCASVGA